MARIAIAALPVTWCPCCLESWRPDMVAVKLASVTICGGCVKKAERLVATEEQRRLDDEKARRGEL